MSNDRESEIVHRDLDTDQATPAIQIAEIVADLEDADVAELTATWTTIDDILDNIFSNPPAPEAQVQITFSYEGYRITVEQNGSAKLVKTD